MAVVVFVALLAVSAAAVSLSVWWRVHQLAADVWAIRLPLPVEPTPPQFEAIWNALGTAAPNRKAAVLRQVADSEIEAQIRAGYLIDAVKLYREKTGAGLMEAQSAVEAWRVRMWAS
jgi:hypothetical protein